MDSKVDFAAVDETNGSPPAASKRGQEVKCEKAHGRWTLLAYGGLALPLCLAEIPIVVYLPAFYAQELALGTGLVGVVFLIARLWDGMSDLLVGTLSDHSKSRFGRRKPWVIAGAPFLMMSTWFLCNPPRGAGFGYLVLWAALFYTAFTAVKIPHLSWGTELATEYVERSRVTTFRETFTMLGILLFVSAPLVLLPENAPLRGVLFLISISVMVSVPIATLLLGVWVRDPVPRGRVQANLLEELAVLARDRVMIRFVIARLVWSIEEGIAASVLVFAFNVGLQLPSKFLWAIFILWTTSLCVAPLTLRLGARIEKHWLLAGGVMIQALTYAAVLFAPLGNFHVVATLWIVLGVANTAMLSIPTSILADIIDNGEVLTGERRSGAYVAVDNLVYKIGMALGVGVSFGVLALIGFEPGASQHTFTDIRDIRLIGFGLPCLLSATAALLYMRHPITRKIQLKHRKTIDARIGILNSRNTG